VARCDVTYAQVTLGLLQGRPSRRGACTMKSSHPHARGAIARSGWRALPWAAMGTLLYDAQYPGRTRWHGAARALPGRIRPAPGNRPRRWRDPMERRSHRRDSPRRPGSANLWRYLKALSNDPDRSERIWLAYGNEDRLRRGDAPAHPGAAPAAGVRGGRGDTSGRCGHRRRARSCGRSMRRRAPRERRATQ
jgi:hypothetical protein